jgi:hypothetical protein
MGDMDMPDETDYFWGRRPDKTFDELFERAKFIVRHSEEEESFAEEDDDIPF